LDEATQDGFPHDMIGHQKLSAGEKNALAPTPRIRVLGEHDPGAFIAVEWWWFSLRRW